MRSVTGRVGGEMFLALWDKKNIYMFRAQERRELTEVPLGTKLARLLLEHRLQRSETSEGSTVRPLF